MTFRELGLCAPIVTALEEQGYHTPSPIQTKAIPHALKGRDVLGCAQTGTGKTCAFAAPILQRLSRRRPEGRPIRALILTPTRELAIQIGESFRAYGAHMKLRYAVIFGGVGQTPQVEQLKRGVDILIATPGRLGDLYQQQWVDLSQLEIFVLDEADRMLDMGFIHDVRKILTWLPQKKQTLFFSATMPPEITDLVNALLNHPVRVAVDPVSSPVDAIRQSVYLVDKSNKTPLLAHLVQTLRVKNALVFTRTKHGANKVARDLEKIGISAAAIHGNKSQTARQQALQDFKTGRIQCLVATDIAARGLDIDALSHVFNYNLTEVPETYIHRIGRTGRAGRNGIAISLCDPGEQDLLRGIETLLGRSLPVVASHPFPIQETPVPKPAKPESTPLRNTARSKRPPLTRSGVLMDTGNAMPNTEFHRPNPLESDIVLDATARLLAPRHTSRTSLARTTPHKPSVQSMAQSADVPSSTGKKKRKKKPVKKSPAASANARQASPSPPLAWEQRPKKALPNQNSKRPSVAPGPKKGTAKKHRTNHSPNLDGQKSHLKDSTQQASLMKPYYLDFER